MRRLGVLTIGQSPRTDMIPEIAATVGPGVEILEKGALDGLTLAETGAYRPDPGQYALTTRMRDGAEVVVAKEKLIPRLTGAMNEFGREGADVVLLLCVGAFPRFDFRGLVLEPEKIVNRILESLINPGHRLGVILPIPEQVEPARENFSSLTPNLTLTSASPYQDKEHLARAAGELRDAGCDLAVLYCMGFNRTHAELVRNILNKPVLPPAGLTARIAAELLN